MGWTPYEFRFESLDGNRFFSCSSETLISTYRTIRCRNPKVAGFPPQRIMSCGICGGQSGTGAGFLQVLRFPSSVLIPPAALHSLPSCHRLYIVYARVSAICIKAVFKLCEVYKTAYTRICGTQQRQHTKIMNQSPSRWKLKSLVALSEWKAVYEMTSHALLGDCFFKTLR
jgi:hypothetical protein